MKVYRDIDFDVPGHPRGVALGTFDGVHLGHQAIIAELIQDAKVSGRVPAIFTFSDHPDLVFRDKNSFQGFIMSVEEKLEIFAALGVEEVFLMPLVPELYKQTAEEFLQSYMIDKLNAGFIAVGEDARFGSGRAGDVEYLLSWGKKNNIKTAVIEDINIAQEKVSSTCIRNLLKQGEVGKANLLTGRKFGFKAKGATECVPLVYKLDFISSVSETERDQTRSTINISAAKDNRQYQYEYPEGIVPLPEGKYSGNVYFQREGIPSVPAELEIKRIVGKYVIIVYGSVPYGQDALWQSKTCL